MKQRNYYITTPIYYPSGNPHLGHAYSSVVADVFARFKRNDDYNVFFLTGTDEHGLKIQKSAEKNGKSPKDFCDEISSIFNDFMKSLNLSNDDFIRTTETRHHKAVIDLWNKLVKSGDIYLSKYKGWYSISDEAYYFNDEVIDKDGKKVSLASGSLVEWVEEESYFFKLSSWQDKLLRHYEMNKNFILPESRRNEVIKFVKNGLKDLSISRTSFTWGIPVPDNKKHIIYVWMDALTNYISALNYPDKNNKLFKAFWPASLHVIGKDILRFHAVYWPAFLLAAGIKLPKKILSHGWILSGDEKMSKSKGNILNPIEIIDKYGVDQLRYYLMKEVSLGNDGTVSLSNLEKCINSDLANNYGNLCQRIISFIKTNCNSIIPEKKNITSLELDLIKNDNIDILRDLMENQEMNKYIKIVIDMSFNTNKYINDTEPWKLKKTDVDRMNTVLNVSVNQIRKISILLNPIIPQATEKVLNILKVPAENRNLESLNKQKPFDLDTEIGDLEILFKKFS